MVPVYDAANSTDAHLVKNLLERAGIASYIRGEYLQGGLGDLPVSGMVQVCVDAADAARAREIVVDWQAAVSVEDRMDDAADVVERPTASGAGLGRLLSAVLIGGAIGAGAMWLALRAPSAGSAIDYNGDGRPDEHLFYQGETIARIETDRNFDGKVDLITRFAPEGPATRAESDNDFDGRMEITARFLHNQWQSEESDNNGDGTIDYKADAISGVIYSQQWLDASGRVSKRVQYKGGIATHGDVDTDADGKLDTRHHYDRTGEIVRSEKL
ncbi:DUF2007 domain-containing protein [Luteimonas gilva]|uniref:DUF2007 domain-containing protein n=1 Tax=Luteimonas gilva TaxID=2572684 RepID=A0A4U5JLK0_9GAMM|nr:DUF2007 domain-containing protein [Luteimonas gilva]TKR29391.1 DUF2007 domain-containing protein [Luteimonas gilva]